MVHDYLNDVKMKSDFSIPALLMFILAIIMLVFILAGLRIILKKSTHSAIRQQKIFVISGICIVGWVIILGALALAGFFLDLSHLPPRPLFAILIPLPVVLIIALSKRGTQLLRLIPPQWLIFIQAFRILVEIILWMAFLQHLLPVQMTFEGLNFDVLSGVLAIPVGYYCFVAKRWSGKIAMVYNIFGLLLLLNILTVAMLSMPTPLRYFVSEPANTIVGTFPFIYLPGVLVPIAYSMHIFSLRQLQLKEGV